MEVYVVIDYTNYKGERAKHTVAPVTIAYVTHEWYPDEQWLLIALDLKENKIQHFAMNDIHSWQPFE